MVTVWNQKALLHRYRSILLGGIVYNKGYVVCACVNVSCNVSSRDGCGIFTIGGVYSINIPAILQCPLAWLHSLLAFGAPVKTFSPLELMATAHPNLLGDCLLLSGQIVTNCFHSSRSGISSLVVPLLPSTTMR